MFNCLLVLVVFTAQSTWRMHVVRSQWREFRRRKWAAGVLCMAWMLNLKYRALRTALVEAKMKRLERFNARHDVSEVISASPYS